MKKEVSKHGRVFLLLDALDEFPESSRTELIDCLRSLGANVNVLVTSRDIEGIGDIFSDGFRLNIEAQDGDVSLYVQERIKTEAKLSKICQRRPDLAKEVEDTILQKSQKM